MDRIRTISPAVVLLMVGWLLAAGPANSQPTPDSWNITEQTDIAPLGFPRPSLRATNTRGDVFLVGTDASGRVAGFLFNDGEGREIFALGEQVHGADGTPLGEIVFAIAAVLFHNGTLLLETTFLPPGAPAGTQSVRFLTFDGSGFELTSLPPERTIVSDLLSGRVTVSGRYLMADRQSPGNLRNYYIMNGTEQEGQFPFRLVDGSVTRRILDYNDDFILLYQSQFTVLAVNFFGEPIHVRESWQLDIRNLQKTRIVAQGFNEEQADFSFGLFNLRVRTLTSATGQRMERAWLSDNGEVISAIRNARVGEPTIGFREPLLQRRRPDTVATLIYDMNQTSPLLLTLSDVVSALPGGAILVTAEESASGRFGFFALKPGSIQPIVRTDDIIGATVVDGFPLLDVNALRTAESSLAFTYRPQGAAGIDRVAVALPPNSGLVAWKNAQGGEWAEAGNWNPERVPVPNEQTLFDLPGAYTVNVGEQRAGPLRIERGSPRFTAPNLQLGGDLRIGGPSTLVVSGGQVAASGLTLGHLSRQLAEVQAEAAGLTLRDATLLELTSEAVIGERGSAELRILPGSSLFAHSVSIGRQAPGTVNVAGLLTAADRFVIGDGRAGSLVVAAPGTMFSLGAVIGGGVRGDLDQGAGQVSVSGNWDNAGDLTVGADQEGFLFVFGTVNQVGDLKVGIRPRTEPDNDEVPAQGIVGVVGPGAQLSVSGDAQVGREGGFGVLSASNGGEIRIGEGLAVPFQGAGSRGLMLIEGVAPDGARASLLLGPEAVGAGAEPCLLGLFGSSGEVRVLAGGSWRCPLVTLGGEGSGTVVLDGRRGDFRSELNARTICAGGGGRNRDGTLLCGSPILSFGRLIVQRGAEARTESLFVGPLGRVVGDGIVFTFIANIQGTVAPGIDLFEEGVPIIPLEPLSGRGALRSMEPADAEAPVLEGRVSPASSELFIEAGPSRSLFFAASSVVALNETPSPSTLTLTGSVTFDSGSVIELDIWGADPSLHDRLVVDGTLTLDGATLVLNFRNGYSPGESDLLDLIEASGGVTGAFGSVVLNGLAFAGDSRIDIVNGRITLTVLNDAGQGGGGGGNEPLAPPPVAIPTLSHFGLMLLGLLLFAAVFRTRGRSDVLR